MNVYNKTRNAIRALRAKEYGFRKQIWQHWRNPAANSIPVFLVGCGRSGTNMIVFQLSQSWQIDLYNEDDLRAFTQWRLQSLETISQLIIQSHAQVVLFKPINDTYRTDHLLHQFPEAKALFAFRHFDDVVNSMLKAFGARNRDSVKQWIESNFEEFRLSPPRPETQDMIRSLYHPSITAESGAALYWLLQNRFFFDQCLDSSPRVLPIQYESLVQDTEANFRKICGFVGIGFRPKLLQGIFTSSLKRNTAPQLESEIRSACTELYQNLCQHI